MGAPYSKIRSKLNRGIVAWLIEQGAGSVLDTLPATSRAERKVADGPVTTVRATVCVPDPMLSGNYSVRVMISVRASATQADDEPNPEAARLIFDERVGSVYDALMQSDDGQTLRATMEGVTAAGRALAVDDSNGADPDEKQSAANNADMADFTVLGWYDAGCGDGEADGDGSWWEEILLFDARICASNVD